MPAAAGHDVRVAYLHEDDGFASAPTDSDYKTFGADASLTTLEGNNNAVRVFNPNSREAADIIEQQFEGSWSVDFTLTNPWWLREVIAEPSTTGSSAPYTHEFSGKVPSSFRLYTYNEQTDTERLFKGCIVGSATISADIDGNVTVTLDGAYADEELNESPASPESQPEIGDNDPLTFADATIERPDGTTLSLIQSASLQIQNNTDLIRELGSRFAVDYSPKVRAASIDYDDIKSDESETKRMYGSDSATEPQSSVSNKTTITFAMDNGESGSDKQSLKLQLGTSLADSYGLSGPGDPEANLEGTLSEMSATVTATADNGADTAK